MPHHYALCNQDWWCDGWNSVLIWEIFVMTILPQTNTPRDGETSPPGTLLWCTWNDPWWWHYHYYHFRDDDYGDDNDDDDDDDDQPPSKEDGQEGNGSRDNPRQGDHQTSHPHCNDDDDDHHHHHDKMMPGQSSIKPHHCNETWWYLPVLAYDIRENVDLWFLRKCIAEHKSNMMSSFLVRWVYTVHVLVL